MGGLGKARLIKVLVLGGDSGGSGAPSGGHEENGSSGALPSSTDAHEWKGWAELRDPAQRGHMWCGVWTQQWLLRRVLSGKEHSIRREREGRKWTFTEH